MNYQNLDTLTRTLSTLLWTGNRKRFDMQRYFGGPVHYSLATVPRELQLRWADPTAPGPSSCFGGWCQLLGAVTPEERGMSAFDFTMKWLDISFNRAAYLLHGRWHPTAVARHCLTLITLEEGIAHLETLRESPAHHLDRMLETMSVHVRELAQA